MIFFSNFILCQHEVQKLKLHVSSDAKVFLKTRGV